MIGDGVVDLSHWREGVTSLRDHIACGGYRDAAEHVKGRTVDAKLSEIEFLPVITEPEKIVCAVRNYMDHHNEALAAGLQRELSNFPPIFLRVWRSQCGHGQPVVKPRVSDTLDRTAMARAPAVESSRLSGRGRPIAEVGAGLASLAEAAVQRLN